MSIGRTRDDFDRFADHVAPGGIERRAGVGGVLAALGLPSDPVRCGRFELRGKLGEGAMGVVYRAFDPALRRDVALKVLRDGPSPSLQDRLQQEARALARQQHPHIVQVLACGRDHGRTWIAMELVPGVTLARWCAAHPPGSAERLRTALAYLRAAAEGLAAAHAVGLVHRDVKPANILVREDGVVKLADFGLARLEAPAETEPGSSLDLDPGRAYDLSRTGAVVGTPLYMSPEQHEGRSADARSDQFSFAVTAWEALGGVPPFAGRTLAQLLDAVSSERIEIESARHVPSALRPVLRRAMSSRPERRYASMSAFQSAWSRAVLPRRAPLFVAGAALGGMVLVAASLAAGRPAVCNGQAATSAFESIWNPERRRAVGAALGRHEAAWNPTTDERLADVLAGYGAHWTDAEVIACEGARDEDEAGARALDRHAACRAHAFETTDALLTRFESADLRLAEDVLAAVGELPLPSACGARVEESSARSAPLRRRLAQAEADLIAGDHAAAATAARGVAAKADDASLSLLRSEALSLAARASAELSDPDTLELNIEAHSLAMGRDASELAVSPAIGAAVWLAGHGELERAREWLRHATVAMSRAPRSSVHQAAVTRAECVILDEEGRLDEALSRCQDALSALDGGTQASPGLRARIRTRIANLYQALGRHDDALVLATALKAESEAELGPWHPTIGGRLMNLGSAAHRTGDFTLAEESFLRAAEIFRAAYGDHHRYVVSAHMNLGSLRHSQRDYVGAEAPLELALAATGGREDAATARVLHNLAEVRRKLGHPVEALDLLARVQVIEDMALEPGHLQTASTHHTRGNVYLDLGRLEEAERELQAARELWARSGRTKLDELDESLQRLQELQELRAAVPSVPP